MLDGELRQALPSPKKRVLNLSAVALSLPLPSPMPSPLLPLSLKPANPVSLEEMLTALTSSKYKGGSHSVKALCFLKSPELSCELRLHGLAQS
ncbi:uncharacterized [Tachysurus ichikawai]